MGHFVKCVGQLSTLQMTLGLGDPDHGQLVIPGTTVYSDVPWPGWHVTLTTPLGV